MERPGGIVWFERIMFASLAVGCIQSAILFPSLARIGGPLPVLTVQVTVLGVFVALTLLVSRRRSNIAKWILIALAVIGLPMFVSHVINGQYVGAPVIGFVQIIGQLLAYALLFTGASRRWLKRERAEA